LPSLHTLLKQEVIPVFYARDENGIPTACVARIRGSMACLTPRFSANRAVREYTKQYYLPAARGFCGIYSGAKKKASDSQRRAIKKA
jgi:starch phosphorylase